MANYELVPVDIPANVQQSEYIERWLEQVSGRGGQLVTFLPTQVATKVIGVFIVARPGMLRQ
jgi:hypothetical protein